MLVYSYFFLIRFVVNLCVVILLILYKVVINKIVLRAGPIPIFGLSSYYNNKFFFLDVVEWIKIYIIMLFLVLKIIYF